MRTFSLLVLALALGACDALETTDAFSVPPVERVRYVQVRYELSASYAGCAVARKDEERKTVQEDISSMPWTEQHLVKVSRSAPFVASIAATCADSAKVGKSHVFIYVNDELVKRSSAVGFGATAAATYTIVGD